MSTVPHGPLSTYAPDLFAGKTVLVTGGGRGIGRLTALAFARLGADVSIAARNAENLAKTHAEIEGFGRRCVSNATDIRDVDSVEASISVADTFFITSALLFGPGPATVVIAVDSLVLSWRKAARCSGRCSRQSFRSWPVNFDLARKEIVRRSYRL